MKVEIDDDCADDILVAQLKQCRKHARLFRGPRAEDRQYYQKLSAAITVVLKHFTPPSEHD